VKSSVRLPARGDVPPTRRVLRTSGLLMKRALPVARVGRAAAEGEEDLCQFLLPRCIIYKWHLAPAGSQAARIN
jgi:hypothetical protein